jgi:hypothetical protein
MKLPVKHLIDECIKIADIVTDRHGFVAIRNLATACKCQIVPRPLLVEAAITTSIQTPDSWVVLINNEIHQFSDEDFEYESSVSPLRVRTRNTLAHEVAHAVACDLLGMDFAGSGNLAERLNSIERAVEKVSPLLLIPKSYLLSRLRQIQNADESLQGFARLPKSFGVSRQTLLQTVKTLSKYYRSNFIQCESLLGALWGIIEFRGKGAFCTSSKWTFDNHFTSTPHPASRLIQQRSSATWTIDSFNQSQGRHFCIARLDDQSSGAIWAQFELEELPQAGRQKMFFRLVGRPTSDSANHTIFNTQFSPNSPLTTLLQAVQMTA